MRFIVSKDGRLIGGITCSVSTRDHLRAHGYTLLAA